MPHTPGPWRVDPKAITRVVAGANDTVAVTGCQSDLIDEWPPNAEFIVRACNAHDEMLAALQELLECADAECVSGSSHEPIERARAVIAKATGQQS